MAFKKFSYWRLLEPILLGSFANITINFIFNPRNPDFILEEFLIAIFFSFIITEINHQINLHLDKKHHWTQSFSKRFLYHLGYLSLFLIIVLNVIGNLYIWLAGHSFHPLNETLTINLSVFILAFILTTLKWAKHFYQSWKTTETHLYDSASKLHSLQSEIDKSSSQIELIKGNNLHQVSVEEIRFAKTEHGIVRVYYNQGEDAVFNGTLNGLYDLLPDYSFFLVSRNIILHRDSILSIASSSYGKIDVSPKEDLTKEGIITVSRLKAAAFRKWYYSSSTANE